MLSAKIGARIMLLDNLSVTHGWVNGTICTVISYTRDTTTIVKISNETEHLEVIRTRREVPSTGYERT